MNDKKVQKIIFSALFAALCCGATMAIKFPTIMGGYVHAGDAVVLLGAFLLGPGWGALAAGLGSALADILAGYAIYAPGTLVIKALMALSAGGILSSIGMKKPVTAAVLAGIVAELIMVLGYFLYSCFPLGYGLAALGDIVANLMQGVFGAAAGVALFAALRKTPYVKQNFEIKAHKKSEK
ncbi:MAG: ECF transporter S component [Oscillospiraceae bacterium]